MQNLYPDLALGNSLYYCGFKPKSENLIFFYWLLHDERSFNNMKQKLSMDFL